MYKLSTGSEEAAAEFQHPDRYCRQATSGPERLVLAPATGHLDLILELAAGWSGGVWLLYVLLTPRNGQAESGRYQSPGLLDHGALSGFCRRFAEFLECDGRHAFWVSSGSNEGLLVYDQHQIIYAYGDLDRFEQVAKDRGLSEGEVRVPAPHTPSLPPFSR